MTWIIWFALQGCGKSLFFHGLRWYFWGASRPWNWGMCWATPNSWPLWASSKAGGPWSVVRLDGLDWLDGSLSHGEPMFFSFFLHVTGAKGSKELKLGEPMNLKGAKIEIWVTRFTRKNHGGGLLGIIILKSWKNFSWDEIRTWY